MPSMVKEIMMKEVAQELERNPYAFISSFESLAVADLSDLRRNLEKVAKRSLVVKHSIIKKVFLGLHFTEAEKFLKANVLVTLGDKDPQVISKALVDFAKANERLVPEGVLFEKKVFGREYIQSLAQLPSRHELLTQVAVRVKSPISSFVITLSQVLRGLAVALNEIKRKKETLAGSTQ
jgi:large subunit ribosomal protein L10